VANKYVQRRVGDRNASDLIQQLFKGNVFQAMIPASIEVRYSQQARMDLYRFNRDSPATLAMAQMVDEAVRRMNGAAH
jgi:cellulose biosynthesis protein BcsQ